MKITCFAVLLLSAALIEASPARKAEKTSLSEDSKLEAKSTDLKIEELGEDKDRPKKSPATFCVEVKPESSQLRQVSCKESQAAAQNVPVTVQTQAISQPIQTLSVLQPFAQVPQASIVVPQPIVQPLQTLQIVQSAPQPCAQTIPVVKTEQKPQAKPTTEAPKPERIEEVPQRLPQPLPRPQETFSILPVAAPCHEHAFAYPSSSLVLISEPEAMQYASVIQVPSMASCNNPLHGFVSPCTCQSNIAMLSEPGMEAATRTMLPLMSYPSSLAKSSFVMPYDSRMASFMQQEKPAPQQRTSTHIHVKGLVAPSLHPHVHNHDLNNYQHVYQKTLIKGPNVLSASSYPVANLMENMYIPGITINAYPQILRGMAPMQHPEFRSSENGDAKNAAHALNIPAALEASDLQQSKKVSREADPSYLSPERIQEIEEEKGKAFLIDGRRNTRSNKETKSQKSEA